MSGPAGKPPALPSRTAGALRSGPRGAPRRNRPQGPHDDAPGATPPDTPGPTGPRRNQTRRKPRRHPDAGWSSPVARQAHNLKVAGSNPAPATRHKKPPAITGGFFMPGRRSRSVAKRDEGPVRHPRAARRLRSPHGAPERSLEIRQPVREETSAIFPAGARNDDGGMADLRRRPPRGRPSPAIGAERTASPEPVARSMRQSRTRPIAREEGRRQRARRERHGLYPLCIVSAPVLWSKHQPCSEDFFTGQLRI
jgi:hypothetical protein